MPSDGSGRRVPEGHLRIAQRFSVGFGGRWDQPSPEGAADPTLLNRPSGTYPFGCGDPTLKHWAIVTHPSGTHLIQSPPC